MATKKNRRSVDPLSVDGFNNAAKTLLANIRFSNVDNPVRTVVITSSVPDEGKSTVSLALAKAMATSGKTCLLVECDMRRRSLAERIGVHPSSGLYSILAGEEKLEDVVVSVPGGSLWFLDAEPGIPSPSDIIASRRFSQFIESLKQRFDYVVFDTPPIGAFVDAAVLGGLADATVLVARQHYVKRADLERSFDQLKQAGANVVGVAMNHCEREGNSYYYYSYYSDGTRRRSKSKSSSGHSHRSKSSSHGAGHFKR